MHRNSTTHLRMLPKVKYGPTKCVQSLDKYWLYCHCLWPDPRNKPSSKDEEAGIVRTGPSSGQDLQEPSLAGFDDAVCPCLLSPARGMLAAGK